MNKDELKELALMVLYTTIIAGWVALLGVLLLGALIQLF